MEKVKINDIEYEFLENYNDAFNKEETEQKLTDFFEPYDYIVGDLAYGKLRLKGFCDKKNKIFNQTNDIKNKDQYLAEDCAYGCKYFVIRKSV